MCPAEFRVVMDTNGVRTLERREAHNHDLAYIDCKFNLQEAAGAEILSSLTAVHCMEDRRILSSASSRVIPQVSSANHNLQLSSDLAAYAISS